MVHINYTTGTRTLPEYMHAPSGRSACVYFRQRTRTCGIALHDYYDSEELYQAKNYSAQYYSAHFQYIASLFILQGIIHIV